MLGMLFAAALSQAAVETSPTGDDYTVVADVTIIAHPVDPLLTVVVDGDLQLESLVRSDPVGVRCGAHEHRYATLGSPRLCWIRRPAGSEIVLSAHDAGVFGADWSIVWEGCAPREDGRSCRLTLNDATEVRATYSRD